MPVRRLNPLPFLPLQHVFVVCAHHGANRRAFTQRLRHERFTVPNHLSGFKHTLDVSLRDEYYRACIGNHVIARMYRDLPD